MSANIYIAPPAGFDKVKYSSIEHAIPLGEQLAEQATARAQAVVAFYKTVRDGDLPLDLCDGLTRTFNGMAVDHVFWKAPAPTPPPATPPAKQ